uniref:Large ribosomal subunit protein bL33 n=1 Tax=candidate division WOR-3 bacterium TaxID=2052148 RepID=A0A7C4U6Y4_UNCW3
MREQITFVCSVCKSKNYYSTKNKKLKKDKIVIKKFCPKCRKHTEHKEEK